MGICLGVRGSNINRKIEYGYLSGRERVKQEEYDECMGIYLVERGLNRKRKIEYGHLPGGERVKQEEKDITWAFTWWWWG